MTSDKDKLSVACSKRRTSKQHQVAVASIRSGDAFMGKRHRSIPAAIVNVMPQTVKAIMITIHITRDPPSTDGPAGVTPLAQMNQRVLQCMGFPIRQH